MIIGLVSQKGGVGKSTLTRLIAREYANSNWTVKIADMDAKQGTSTRWNMLRNEANFEPAIKTEQYRSVSGAIDDYNKGEVDLMIFDGAPAASAATLQISKASNLIVLPTGISVDDLEPTVRLAHELVKNGIARNHIVIVFCRVGDSLGEIKDAREYIEEVGYNTINASLPERVAYRRSQDVGKSVAETTFKSLNNRASSIAQELIDLIQKLDGK
ncbi:MAG: ParA family protein [Rhizobiales bacterium]|nr:ParA family protein [Hyphomicrobiales bacterium]